MSNNYNPVYEKLVKNKKDFVGMTAYAIYKYEKREQIRGDRSIEEFVRIKSQKNEIKRYRDEAEELINAFLEGAAADSLESVKKEVVKEIHSIAIKSLPKQTTWERFSSWHNGGAAGIFGNFWTGAIVAILVWLLSSPETWEKAKSSAKNTVSSVITIGHASTDKSEAKHGGDVR